MVMLGNEKKIKRTRWIERKWGKLSAMKGGGMKRGPVISLGSMPC